MILILVFCFALAAGDEPVGPAGSNLRWRELRHNANVAEDSGDFKAAQQYYLQALRAAVNGSDPTGQLLAAEELGQLYWKMDNAPSAATYLHMAAAVLHQYFPGDSERKATALSNLGIVLTHTGSFNEAEESLLEALRIFHNLNSHEHVAATYDDLASVEICRSKYTLAEEYEKSSLAILKEHGLENMTTARSLANLAHVYAIAGRIREAEKLIAHDEAIVRRYLPSFNADLMQCLDTKAGLLFEQQRFSEAERLWKSIIESARVAQPPFVLVNAPFHLSELYVQTKQYGKAEELLDELLQSKPNVNPDELSRALVEGQLAFVLMQQHKDERADALFRSAISTVAASPANASFGYAIICLRYAKFKARRKDWREAASYMERGVKIESAVLPQSIAMAQALELSAQIYGKLSRRDDAKDCLNRAKAIRATIEKPRPSSTVDVGMLAAEMR